MYGIDIGIEYVCFGRSITADAEAGISKYQLFLAARSIRIAQIGASQSVTEAEEQC